jgi:hypothetical protein
MARICNARINSSQEPIAQQWPGYRDIKHCKNRLLDFHQIYFKFPENEKMNNSKGGNMFQTAPHSSMSQQTLWQKVGTHSWHS